MRRECEFFQMWAWVRAWVRVPSDQVSGCLGIITSGSISSFYIQFFFANTLTISTFLVVVIKLFNSSNYTFNSVSRYIVLLAQLVGFVSIYVDCNVDYSYELVN